MKKLVHVFAAILAILMIAAVCTACGDDNGTVLLPELNGGNNTNIVNTLDGTYHLVSATDPDGNDQTSRYQAINLTLTISGTTGTITGEGNTINLAINTATNTMVASREGYSNTETYTYVLSGNTITLNIEGGIVVMQK